MRSHRKELLDEDIIPTAALHRNLYELEVINSLLGGHNATIKGLKKLISLRSQHNNPLTIIDIGCGGGDTLKAIARCTQAHSLSLTLIGVDLKQDAIDYARSNCLLHNNISFVQSDYKLLPALDLQADIYINSLFCHHLNDTEIEQLLLFMKNARIGFLINDLQRHWLAYYSIKFLTWAFSKSYLVKNDAPLSVLRGFKRKELASLARQAKTPVNITWKWAFRWIITYKNPANG